MRLLALLAALVCAASAWGQGYPSKPIRLIVGYPPGGSGDFTTRLIADELARDLGATVIVENKAGAGGSIASEFVAKSAPDGYTLLNQGNHAIAKNLYKNLGYDQKDFAPISRVAVGTTILVVNNDTPFKNLQDLVAYAKANPGKLNVANVGSSTLGYLMTLQFRALTGTEMQDIYYKGSSQVYPDLISGQVQLFLDNPGASTPLVNAGRLKAFGVTSATPSMPGVRLFSDSGLKGYDTEFWYGLVAPAGTPRAIVGRIQAEVARYVRSAEGRKEFAARSLEPVGSTPEQFAATIRSDMERFREFAARLGVKVQ